MNITLEIRNAPDTDALGVYLAVAIGEGEVQGVFQGDGAEIDAWIAQEGFVVTEVEDIASLA